MKIKLDVNPVEFIAFFKAMIDEMERHDEKKGSTWKRGQSVQFSRSDGCYADQDVQDKYLDHLLNEAFVDYKETRRLDQLVDIANFCAMIFCRGEIILRKEYIMEE